MTTSNQPTTSEPFDYLVIGHLTADLTPTGVRLGGTAAFSGLTAHALGLKTGVITAFSDNLDTTPIQSLWIKNKGSACTTTFKNISDGTNRTQYLYHTADTITENDQQEFNPPPKIIHLGPVADEVDPEILTCYPHSLKCMTPQGWFRHADGQNRVSLKPWDNAEFYLNMADAAVISIDDVQKDEAMIAKMAASIPVFAVTENFRGARIYWHNDARYITAPEVKYVDDTGAGDIFAAAFFYRYYFTKDPWESGRFAVQLASGSVTREFLESIPSPEEIEKAKLELMG